MKHLFFISIAFLCVVNCYPQRKSRTARIVLAGTFQGKNLYIQNPTSSGVGFCITKCTVNGQAPCENKSAFELDLYCHNLRIGDSVLVVIEHDTSCTPRILNPEVLRPVCTFEIVDINASASGILSWSTVMESGSLPFVIEQFRWNKWIKIGEVAGKGIPEINQYTFNLNGNLHSGMNKFRVKQVGNSGKPKWSESVEITPNLPEISIDRVQRKFGKVHFTGATRYEIFDAYGNIVRRGHSQQVDIVNLRKGVYYVHYDNKSEKFVKR